MSISPSTNLILVDATNNSGVITLPNPSTIQGNILIIRDLSNTISPNSTVTIQTPLSTPIVTLSTPGGFITLVAAPLNTRQYHTIGGTTILDQHVSSVNAQAISTAIFTATQDFSFPGVTVSSFQSPSTFIDSLATDTLAITSVKLSQSNTLTASNNQLYVDGLPLNRGKFFNVQEIQAQTGSEIPFLYTNSNSDFPVLWLDPTDSNMMFTDLQQTTHPALGDRVKVWYVKPSTLGIYAVQSNTSRAPYFQGPEGLWFSTLGGMKIVNNNPSAPSSSALPVSFSNNLYFVTTKSSNVEGYQFANTANGASAPTLLNNWNTGTGLYYNGSNFTATGTTDYGYVYFTTFTDGRVLQVPATSGSNMFSFTRAVATTGYVANSSNTLQINLNGSNRYTGYVASQQSMAIDLLGTNTNNTPGGPVCFYGDFLIYNDIVHTRRQKQAIETWLATRWQIRNKLPSDHPGYLPS